MRRALGAAAAATLAATAIVLLVGWPATAQNPCPTPTPTAPSDVWAVDRVEQFPGGLNAFSGSIANIAASTDPKIGMRASATNGGYARGIIDRRPDGSQIRLGDGAIVKASISVVFKDTGRYVSVERFDNYGEYGSPNGSIFGIERWGGDNRLHVVSDTYAGSQPQLARIAGPVVQANVRYDLRLEAKLASTNGAGYTRLYVNGLLAGQSTAANNIAGRAFSKLRAGVVAVASSSAVDFGQVRLEVK